MKKISAFCMALLTMVALAVMVTAIEARAVEPEETDAEILAKVMYTEARGVGSKTEQAAVAWCVLNRVDHEAYPDTVREVVTQRHQFAWRASAPVTKELLELAQDVLLRYELEQLGVGKVGRVLPQGYIFFAADGKGHNRFRRVFKGPGQVYWDWSLESPYIEEI